MIKKLFILLLAIFSAGVFSSCNDYLESDKYFKDRTTIEAVFTDRDRTEQWLAYAYSFLKNQCADVVSKDAGTSSHCFADDMYYGDRDIAYDPKEGSQLSYNKFKLGEYNENEFNEVWPRCYKGIYQASVFIHNIDMNPTMTPEERLDYKGQARFVRAYFYWLLLRKYGPIPLMPDEGVDYTQSYDQIATPRSSYEEVADFISAEMVQAAKELQYLKRMDNENIARPTKGAALATRAYALIFAASPLANGNNDEFAQALVDDQGRRLLSPEYNEEKWAKAAAACKDVMELGVYELYHASFSSSDNGPQDRPTIVPPSDNNFSTKIWPNGWKDIDPFKSYRNLFSGDVSAVDNPELIFSRINNTTDGDYAIEALVLHQMPRDFGGWNTHGLTQKMCDAYYMNNGSDCPGKDKEIGRGDGSQRLTGFTTKEDVEKGLYKPLSENVSLQYANREPRFYASVAYNGAVWNYMSRTEPNDRNRQTFYYRGLGNGFMNSPFHLRTGIGIMKFVNPEDSPGNIRKKPEPAIRYADILLLYAEALNELDGTYNIPSWDESMTYTISRNKEEMQKGIHPVRIRAGLPDYTETQYANKDELRKALKRERMIELMGEGKRYYDLRRWKDAPVEEALQIYGCNVVMDETHRNEFHVPIAIYNLPSTFSPKMYFWPIRHDELKHNKRLTQNPGWTMYD
ncbi:RagB/SusD family nutrient uptake outer membrane protein [Bacteroides faecichinchillae]|uniref:Starch-binding associating with outer membrane n=1 Tax=Bacteroides faecichinchillae TaxID=871325 RepID=A0A1M5EQH6_9BACE|nr:MULTISPECIES: RagB/SusD family nutrient uptake outer membrane protein [Bacteroides]THG56439.1 RagB/SusD family nutrient uptake outer membrane protein [Bacteroides faecichinchillae]SHF81543.1 Starch-binding associating with outer membrane [Bacteroides faecichinchillae]